MPENLNDANAVVIGGGPAGCALAILLARAGREVLLLEKSSAAHHKVCGEFISWEAGHYLHLLGIDLREYGAHPIQQLRVYDGEAQLDSALPFPAWGLSRRCLDAALMTLARHAGVAVRCGANVNQMAQHNNEWLLSTTQGAEWRAQHVFLASGKYDVSGWPREHQQSDFIGFKMHLRLSPTEQRALQECVEVHLFDAGYAGLELVEEAKANLCLLIKRRVYTEVCGKDWQALLAWLSNKASPLKRRLAGAESLWPRPLAVYGTPYGYLHHPKPAESGLFHLGDQMAVIPSFAGDGIAIALHSAFLAAQAFLAGRDATAYHQQALNNFRRPVRIAGLVASLALSAQCRKSVFLLSRLMPGLMTMTIQGTRLAKRDVLCGVS
jgi:menaquinone-9 beta-reductase